MADRPGCRLDSRENGVLSAVLEVLLGVEAQGSASIARDDLGQNLWRAAHAGALLVPSLVDLRYTREADFYTSYPTTSSSCLSCSFKGIIANARSRKRQSRGFSSWPTWPMRRDCLTILAVLAARSSS